MGTTGNCTMQVRDAKKKDKDKTGQDRQAGQTGQTDRRTGQKVQTECCNSEEGLKAVERTGQKVQTGACNS